MTIPTVMTIIAAPGSGTPSAAAGNAPLGTDGAGFASLVQMLLAQQQSGTPGGAATAGGAVPQDGQNAVDGEKTAGEETAQTAVGPAAAEVADDRTASLSEPVGTPIGAVPAAAFGVDAPPSAPVPHGGAKGVTKGLNGVTNGPADGSGTGAVADATTTSGPVTPEAPKGADGTGGAGTATQSTTESATSGGGTPATEPTPTPVHGTTAAAEHQSNAGNNRPVDTGAAGLLSGATGVVSGPAGAATASPAAADVAGPVGGQVFPEVARLVTRGDGTQRLTLRLTPEALGEVRIVVTVRDGAVDVSLAAGGQAQESLLHGSPELRRLLESMGATSTQIAVRDLPSAPQQSGGGTAYADATGTGPGRDEQGGGDPSARRHTAGGHPAGPSTATSRSGSTDPTTEASASGVDLRL